MISGAHFTCQTARFQQAMQEFGKHTKKSLAKVVRNEMRLLVGDLIKLTPPAYGKGSSKAAQRQGEAAVSGDIQRVFFPVDGKKAPSVNPAEHERRRNSRGRVYKKLHAEIRANRQSLNQYIKIIQKHVGRAKSGWLAAANKFGFKGAPAWVTRQNVGRGSAVDKLGEHGGYLEAINTNKAIGTLDTEARVVYNAMKLRVRSIYTKLQGALDYEAKRALKRAA